MKTNVLLWATLAGLWQVSGAATGSPRSVKRSTRQQNGSWDFESGKLKPWFGLSEGSQGTDRARVKVVSPGYNSQYAASLGPAPSGGHGTMATSINGDPNTNYTISAMYKVVDAATGCNFSATGGDDAEPTNDISTTLPMTVGDWTPISVVWPNFIDQYGTFSIEFSVDCPGRKDNATVLIDNIDLKATGTLQPSSCPGSTEVQNGDFETGNADGWRTVDGEGSTFSVVSPGYNSDHALSVGFTGQPDVGAAWSNELHGVCFNYYYEYSFALNWVNYSPIPTSTPAGGACSISPSAYNCDKGDELGNIWPSAEGWQTHTFNCTTQSDSIQLYFQLDCGPDAPKQSWSVQVDDVQFKYVGGPAPPPKNPFPGNPTHTPTPTPTPSPGASRKRAEYLANPRWL